MSRADLTTRRTKGQRTRRRTASLLAAAILATGVTATTGPRPADAATAGPALAVSDYVTGANLRIPWGLAFTPDGTLLFTQRAGKVSARLTNGQTRQLAADMGDLFVAVETGLLDLELDTDFATNRRFYTCQAYTSDGTNPTDVRVIAWSVDAGYTTAVRTGTVLTGIPITTGQHTGCRLLSQAGNVLFVTTGDARIGSGPQDLSSLAGKILRVHDTSGAGLSGNAFFADPDPDVRRIWTYGHRNVQGLAFRPGTTQLWAAEHGTNVDDELNRISKGRNYGWDPGPSPGYNAFAPMTDRTKFPTSEWPQWRSGATTPATSGLTWIVGDDWGDWHGAMAVACLADQYLMILHFSAKAQFQRKAITLQGYGRLRSVEPGPDGALYVATSNGADDRILRVAPVSV